jgi:alanine or glycine:cation symporter, AGCS family
MIRWIWLAVCVLMFSGVVAQDTSLVAYAEQGPKSIDERINDRVSPITNAVEAIIFYAIPLKYDLEFQGHTGTDFRFTKEVPYRVEWEGPGSYAGKYFTITYVSDSLYQLRYDFVDADGHTRRVMSNATFGSWVEMDGLRYRVFPEGTERVTTEYRFRIQQISLPLIVVWLIAGALFFTFYFRFINLRKFGLALNIVRGKYTDPKEAGEVSHFQALTAALSGTVGLGNIAGVAIAISLGGPGATFWMILAGLLGMSSKFVECTLGVKYRNIDERGVVHGGPMYYLSQGLKLRGMAGFGKVLAVFFALMCIGGSFGGGNMFQVNQAFQQFNNVFMDSNTSHGWVFGLIMAIFVAVVIIGGIKSIARVTERIVPFMVVIYVLAALIIIFGHLSDVPATFGLIFSGAFAPDAVAGGIIGVLIQGFRRAAFSNEAGIGSASIAHAAVRTENPVSEGLVSLLEPFIDTVVVCTMTALVIIITGNYLTADVSEGIALTSRAFSDVITWFPYVLALAVILFAFSTMISWSYYGLQSWIYLFGNRPWVNVSYKVLFCVMVVVGAAMNLEAVIGFSDAMIFAMSFPNILGILFLLPVVRAELRQYLGRIESGEIIKR